METVATADVQRLIDFYPYQRAWLADQSRFKVGMFTRQGGKSMVACAEIVEDCINAEINGKRTKWVILSRGERQAKLNMKEHVKPMTRAFWTLYRGLLDGPEPDIVEETVRYTRDDGVDSEYTSLSVTFPGGSEIVAVPANPDTVRGFSANMLFDEFAIHQDSKAIWGAAFPIISKGWKVRVVSTPKGKSNKFYDLMTEEPTIWSRHEVDIYQAVEQGLPRNIEELKAGLNDPDLWAQEFELEWLDEAGAWLDYDLINSCETAGYGRLRRIEYKGKVQTVCTESGEALPPARGPVYVGMDIARKKDLTCIWSAEQIGDVLYPREIIVMLRAPFKAQHAELKRLRDRDQPIRFAIDQTGMGEPFVETAQDYLGESRCQGVIFTPAIRFALGTTLKESMEDRKFRLPMGQKDIKDDLHSIAKIVNRVGNVSLLYDGESEGHGDRFWAAALCASAADLPIAKYAYTGVSARSDRPDRRPDGMRVSDEPNRHRRGSRFGRGAW
ncbi:terminase family protein [Sphingopyxis sp. GW247-27LB]|uniref:terminase large subunit domain-containing protein n=1 Tax=Sphingopyxis sp. GW247-27LB TaxID=2012632 RepID=UPI000BA5B490|nr:terminase family protein [Sphingopyxis sp. GW247-27LB]PAL25488.1 terminase [Sphingopyxis sp. GW247-27LB]